MDTRAIDGVNCSCHFSAERKFAKLLVATSCRLPARGQGDAFDEQPQRKQEFEYERRQPLEFGQRPGEETGEL